MKLYYVTFPSEAEQERVAEIVLEERLAACVNTFPSQSRYWWDGSREQADEIVALFKTADDRGDELMARVKEEHPYDVPCILELPVTANQEYAAWIQDATR